MVNRAAGRVADRVGGLKIDDSSSASFAMAASTEKDGSSEDCLTLRMAFSRERPMEGLIAAGGAVAFVP